MSVVLIVDDNPADRALFRAILTRAGYTVQEASRGRDALARAVEVRPHVIVLDVNLPDIDGHEVCRALKAEPSIASIPVLMLTVRDNDDDVIAGLEAGADDYAAKDSASEIVLARVHRLIEFRRLASLAVLNEHLVQIGRLLAGIVHEIRGPLSVIRGSAELMRLQLSPDDPNQQWVEPILRSSQLLQVRLEHLMATVRSGPSCVQTVEIGPLVHESTELFAKGTDPRSIKVAIDEVHEEGLPFVQIDAGRLIQVLLSLFGNALDAISQAQRAGRITVRTLLAFEEEREWVAIEVADDGPGIPERYLERIFEPFFTTKESGSGYGLYMASEILREQQGRLTARNSPEGGACFTIWLPTVPAQTLAGTSTSLDLPGDGDHEGSRV
jgi:signal transduction histidine kinase